MYLKIPIVVEGKNMIILIIIESLNIQKISKCSNSEYKEAKIVENFDICFIFYIKKNWCTQKKPRGFFPNKKKCKEKNKI